MNKKVAEDAFEKKEKAKESIAKESIAKVKEGK